MTLGSGHCRPSAAEIAELVDLSTDEVSALLCDATPGSSEADSDILRRLSELEDRLTLGEGWRGLWGFLLLIFKGHKTVSKLLCMCEACNAGFLNFGASAASSTSRACCHGCLLFKSISGMGHSHCL